MRCCSVLGLGVAFLIVSSSGVSAQGFYGVDVQCEQECETIFHRTKESLMANGLSAEEAGYWATEVYAQCYNQKCAHLAPEIEAASKPRTWLDMLLGNL